MFTMCSGCTPSVLFKIWHSGMEFTIHKCCQPRPGSKTIKVFPKKTPESGLGVLEPWSQKWTNKHSIRYHLVDEGPMPLTIILRVSNRTGFTSQPSTGFLPLTQQWWIHPQCLFEYGQRVDWPVHRLHEVLFRLLRPPLPECKSIQRRI